MLINLILMFKGVNGVDKYLSKHSEYFKNKSYLKTRKFMSRYLNHEYQKRDNSFAFLTYLDNSKVESEFYVDLIKNSKFYKTMMDPDRLEFIKAYATCLGNQSLINDCIDNIFDIDILKEIVTKYVDKDTAPSISDKLLYTEDLDLLLASKNSWFYLKDYLNESIIEFYSLEEVKEYLLNYSNYNDGVFNVLADALNNGYYDKERIFSTFADIITTKVAEKNNSNKETVSSIFKYLNNLYNDLNNYFSL